MSIAIDVLKDKKKELQAAIDKNDVDLRQAQGAVDAKKIVDRQLQKQLDAVNAALDAVQAMEAKQA